MGGGGGGGLHSALMAVLEASADPPSPAYYLRKTIALHNLYGVDIMDEAVEITRLRLFLALAATVEERDGLEPFPDLDMNVRRGNILVGCINTDDLLARRGGDWTVKEQLQAVDARAQALRDDYRLFQEAQRERMGDDVAEFKQHLQQDMQALAHDLDRLYAHADNQKEGWDIENWRLSHHPFHWLAEFPEAILAGGFSVAIGNPPFIRRHKVNYRIEDFETRNAPDIYAPCMERAANLLSYRGRLALIAPISLVSGLKFDGLRSILEHLLPIRWISTFDIRPDKLFQAQVRPVITIGCAGEKKTRFHSSNLRRWRVEYRPYLFQTTCYVISEPVSARKQVWPLIGDSGASTMLRELQASNKQIKHSVSRNGKYRVGRKAAMNRRFMAAFLTEPPCWKGNYSGEAGCRIPQRVIKWLAFEKEFQQHATFLLLAGRLGHLLWTFTGDAFNITGGIIESFPINLDRLEPLSFQLAELANTLDTAQINSPMVDKNIDFIGGFDLEQCRYITDQSDQIIMECLGIGQYWPSVILLDNRIIKSDRQSSTTERRWPKDWTPTRGPWDSSMPE